MLTYVKPFSACKITVFHKPFVYGYIDNFVPADIYQKLEATFLDPTKSENMETFKHGKNRILFYSPPAPAEIPAESPWLEFVNQITSPEYMKDCLKWVQENYEESASDSEDIYTKMMRDRFDVDTSKLKMQCEFSSLEADTFLAPHTDSGDKFISCVYYLAQPEWQDSWGGATEIYQPKNPKYQNNWHNRILPNDAMDLLASCNFRPNRLFFFVKTENSWHGLSPVTSPAGVQRRSFNFSMMADRGAFNKESMATYRKKIKRQEFNAFKGKILMDALREIRLFFKKK